MDSVEEEAIYDLVCGFGHAEQLTDTELERLIDVEEPKCSKCDRPVDLDSEITLECSVCAIAFPVSTLEEAHLTMDDGCRLCEDRGFGSGYVHVPLSFWDAQESFEWARDNKDHDSVLRKKRTDYWEAVAHFCKLREFVSILRDRKIKAAKTGYFNVPAVCLTEAPLGNWGEFRARHGEFGLVFRKSDIIRAGGGPVAYFQENLTRAQLANGGFAPSLKPFVNLLRIRTPKLREAPRLSA